MHGLAVYVKEELPFAWDFSQENSAELIDLVNSVIIFLSQTTLLRYLIFLLQSLIVTLTVLLFWISFFLLTLEFFLQWLSLHLHWEILIILLPQFPLTFQ